MPQNLEHLINRCILVLTDNKSILRGLSFLQVANTVECFCKYANAVLDFFFMLPTKLGVSVVTVTSVLVASVILFCVCCREAHDVYTGQEGKCFLFFPFATVS